MIQRRFAVLVLFILTTLSSFGLQLGPEIPVTDSPITDEAWQQNPTVSRDRTRTLLAWEEIGGPEQLSRVVMHQYEALVGSRQGRETFHLLPSLHHQRRPAFGASMLAWVEEEPNGPGVSIWFQGLEHVLGRSVGPIGKPARVSTDAAPGTRLHVLNRHVFHVILWTARDGRLAAVERSLIARIGYDPSQFFVTSETAVNPSSDGYTALPLIAYNHPVPPQTCPTDACAPRFSIRATVLHGRTPGAAIDIAPVGASAPRVVYDPTRNEFLVFWSMETGGTFAQRVTTGGGTPVLIGGPRKVHDGSLHDATIARGGEYALVVEERDRYAVVRLGAELDVIESLPFYTRLAGGALIEISADEATLPMLTYAASADGGASSRVVFRLVEERVGTTKRRSVR